MILSGHDSVISGRGFAALRSSRLCGSRGVRILVAVPLLQASAVLLRAFGLNRHFKKGLV